MKDEKDEKESARVPIAQRKVYIKEKHNLCNLKPLPKDPTEQNAVADQLVYWSLYTDSLNIDEFAIINRYSPYRLWKIRESNDYFAERLEFAKHTLALRIEEAVEDNKGKKDYTLAIKKFPLYNREYREYLDSRLPERKSPEHQGDIVYKLVEIERCPSSSLVPEKKDAESRVSSELSEE